MKIDAFSKKKNATNRVLSFSLPLWISFAPTASEPQTNTEKATATATTNGDPLYLQVKHYSFVCNFNHKFCLMTIESKIIN